MINSGAGIAPGEPHVRRGGNNMIWLETINAFSATIFTKE